MLDQLCTELGFPRERARLPRYLSGEDPEFTAAFPELMCVRDAAFTFRCCMLPSLDALPGVARWRPADATLSWRHRPDTGTFEVTAFNRQLDCTLGQTATDRSRRPGSNILKACLSTVLPPLCPQEPCRPVACGSVLVGR